MSAQLLEGSRVANAVLQELAQRVEALKARGITPGLGTILVGSDGPSISYVRKKHETCALCPGRHSVLQYRTSGQRLTG